MLESSVGGTPRKKRKKKAWEEHWLALMSPSCPTLVVPTNPPTNALEKDWGWGLVLVLWGPAHQPPSLASFLIGL